MLAYLRKLIISLFIAISAIPLILICLLRPRHPNNAWLAIQTYGQFGKRILGVNVRIRGNTNLPEKAIYICNHQSNVDIFLVCNAVPKGAVTLGKKSILYMPFFGQLYWLSGNLFVDRSNPRQSARDLQTVERSIHEKHLSIWVFPEGTRNYGRGLLPFKTGAVRLAVKANIPIVPVCVNNYYPDFDLNRLHNQDIIVEFQPAISTSNIRGQTAIREFTEQLHSQMTDRIDQLTREIEQSLTKKTHKIETTEL